MKACITGVSGFVGRHLVNYLVEHTSIEPHGIDRSPQTTHPQLAGYAQLDIRDKEAFRNHLERLQPDYIFHLAAQTYVPDSFRDPWETLETNIRGTMNLLEAIRELAMLQTRVLVIGSSETYGYIKPEDLPLKETQPFHPTSPYSVSKITQEMLGVQYYHAYKIPVIRARPFNHIGAGQHPNFVVPNFATQVAEIEQGLKPPILHVGNLAAQRDFTDVRDVVRAYHLIITQGELGAVYNICHGKAISVQSIVDTFVAHAKVPITVHVDSTRLRPLDVPLIIGDYHLLQQHTGWQPTYPIEETLLMVLEDCRERVNKK